MSESLCLLRSHLEGRAIGETSRGGDSRPWLDALHLLEQAEEGVVAESARFRAAVELVIQDIRAQRGDHIAGLVEDSFAVHFARASGASA